MTRFCTLIALLPFILSTSFALPIGNTPLGLSPTSLHPGRAILQSQGPDVMPAAKRARFLMRGDPSDSLIMRVLQLANDPNADRAALQAAMHKGTDALSKLVSSIENGDKVAASTGDEAKVAASTGDEAKVAASTGDEAKVANKPPYRFPWPASRLNLTPSDPKNPTQSTSGNKVSWPSK
ncbi:hypothetical protein CF326_g3718 [Tilletia indica]|nr:hypothetical protein CF326_g3718 [Tilletia indica]